MGLREDGGDDTYDNVRWFLQGYEANIVTCPACGKAAQAEFINTQVDVHPDHQCPFCNATYPLDEFQDLFY